jgi:hypothetical protein
MVSYGISSSNLISRNAKRFVLYERHDSDVTNWKNLLNASILAFITDILVFPNKTRFGNCGKVSPGNASEISV